MPANAGIQVRFGLSAKNRLDSGFRRSRGSFSGYRRRRNWIAREVDTRPTPRSNCTTNDALEIDTAGDLFSTSYHDDSP
jgi:hypothetical protein